MDCLKLSNLHSDAVDYAKSGVPVQLSSIPRLKHGSKPDWNAPETIPSGNPKFYPSKRAIGRLFREITLPALSTVQRALRSQTRTLEQGRQVTLANIVTAFRANYEPDEDDPVQVAVQDRITAFIAVGAHDEDLIVEIWEVFENYVTELQMVCTDNYISTSRNGMLTEEEAVVGTIVAKSSQPTMRREAMAKLREQTSVLVQSVAHQLAGEDGTLFEKSMERAWVAYRIACLEQGYFGAKSFAWIALTEIFDAIRNIEESEGAYT